MLKSKNTNLILHEIFRTFMALVGLFVCTFTMALVQVQLKRISLRLPLSPKPLPDFIVDNIPHLSQYLPLSCDTVLAIFAFSTFGLSFCSKQPFLVFRRLLWLTNILYVFRSSTIALTTLPPVDPNCKIRDVPQDMWGFIENAFLMLLNRKQGCIDLIFSGHAGWTTLLVLFWLVYCKHWLGKLYGVTHGFLVLFMLLDERIHYSVDVVVGILIATLLFTLLHYLLLSGALLLDERDTIAIDIKRMGVTSRIFYGKTLFLIIRWLDGWDLRVTSDHENTLAAPSPENLV